MQFIITGLDGPNKMEKRMEVRPRHLENLGKLSGKVICGGGLLDDEGKMKGSVMIIDFAGQEQLEEYLRTEPYITEGVWETVTAERYNVVFLNGEKVGK